MKSGSVLLPACLSVCIQGGNGVLVMDGDEKGAGAKPFFSVVEGKGFTSTAGALLAPQFRTLLI